MGGTMRILDNDTNRALANISVFLTPADAKEMIGYLEHLLEEPLLHHAHLSDEEYKREITLAVYSESNLNEFDERSRKLIIEGQ